MEWTDIRLTVSKADAEAAEAVATMIAEGGIYIEDYSDIEEQVEQIAHVDLIEQELLDKPRDTVIIHMYLEPGASPVETLALIAARMEAAGIPYTSETEGVEQEDWQNGWRKYYHPMDVGQRLAIVPSWQDYDTDRVKLILDPGLAFGTGGHETTNLCLEVLDERVKGGERVLDIGTGSGILAIAALKLGAAVAEGVDIDPVAVRTAGENAALNGLSDRVEFLCADVFALLPELEAKGQKFDLVILDPPAFTKSRASVKKAVTGYREINLRAMKLIRDGGFLATCSCSHFVDYELFTQTIGQAARNVHKRLRQVEYRTQAPDHPILWDAEDSYYLKFYIFQVCDEK